MNSLPPRLRTNASRSATASTVVASILETISIVSARNSSVKVTLLLTSWCRHGDGQRSSATIEELHGRDRLVEITDVGQVLGQAQRRPRLAEEHIFARIGDDD